MAALASGDTKRAERDWIAAIVAWPNDANAYSRLGDLYQQEGEYEVAGVCYLKLASISPRFAHIYCRLAQGAIDSGDSGDASRYAQKELSLDPQCSVARLLLSRLGETPDPVSRRGAGTPADPDPDNATLVAAYAETFLDTDPAKVIRILTPAWKQFPASAEIAFDLGRSYARVSSDPASQSHALKLLRRAEVLSPREGLVHTELCRILLQMDKTDDAVREGALAFAASPGDMQACFQYRQSLARTGNRVEASRIERRIQTLSTASELQKKLQARFSAHPNDPWIAHRLITADLELDDTYGAYEVSKLAVKLHPLNPLTLQDVKLLASTGVPVAPGRLRIH